MAVKVVREDSSLEIIREILRGSIFGQCYPFAIAMHRELGWPIVGIKRGEDIVHVGVRSPEWDIWDGRGKVSETEFVSPFAHGEVSLTEDIEEDDLFSRQDISDYMIESFTMKIQSLWPYLPWLQKTCEKKTIEFARRLEKLSRKYKIWILAPFAAALPVLSEGMDDEAGYELKLMPDGVTFTINRVLE